MADKEKDFLNALEGKRIAPLVLDNKWYQLFAGEVVPEEIRRKSDELSDLLKAQGSINSDLKKVKALKKKLLDEMMSLADDAANGNAAAQKDADQHKKLIDDCNEHIDDYQDRLLDYPREIDRVNKELMILTMDDCYRRLSENGREIEEIGKWIDEFRIELKKNVVRKQDREMENHRLYSYMHDIFGTEVIDIFDMQYIPSGFKHSSSGDIKEESNTSTGTGDAGGQN